MEAKDEGEADVDAGGDLAEDAGVLGLARVDVGACAGAVVVPAGAFSVDYGAEGGEEGGGVEVEGGVVEVEDEDGAGEEGADGEAGQLGGASGGSGCGSGCWGKCACARSWTVAPCGL